MTIDYAAYQFLGFQLLVQVAKLIYQNIQKSGFSSAQPVVTMTSEKGSLLTTTNVMAVVLAIRSGYPVRISMKVKVEAKVFPDRIELTQNFEDPHFSRAPMVNMQREILKVKDATVRDALISLGWTPPEENNKYIEALKRIANPIEFMQREAKKNGDELNGRAAILLSNDAQYLKDIAKNALTEFKTNQEGTK